MQIYNWLVTVYTIPYSNASEIFLVFREDCLLYRSLDRYYTESILFRFVNKDACILIHLSLAVVTDVQYFGAAKTDLLNILFL